MINSQHLAAVILALSLGTAPLFAQVSGEDAGQPAARDPATGEGTTGQEAPAPDDRPANGQPAERAPQPPTGDSPFDYRSSEKISEDLSVSFPVDI